MLAAGISQNKGGPRAILRQYHRDIVSSLVAMFRRYHCNIMPPENSVSD